MTSPGGAGVGAVGFIGLGHMGRPMLDRLVAAHVPVEVFVRRPELRQELAEAGISVAESASDLASRVDLLILCFFSDAQVRQVMLDDKVIGSLRPGSVLVSHVTGSPALSVELQDAAPEGVVVLDVPISGTEDHIRRGELTVLVGGDQAASERVRPILAAYADPILDVGGLGDGQRVKLLNNLLFTVNLNTARAAARLGESMGITPKELASVVSQCSGASFAVNLFEHLPPEALVESAKHYLKKDVGVIRSVAADQGLELGLLGDLAEWVFED